MSTNQKNMQEALTLMSLQARRDFLRDHLIKIESKTGLSFKSNVHKPRSLSFEDRTKAYQDEIKSLGLSLTLASQKRPELKSYIEMVLPEKEGSDSAGMSTTMSARFGKPFNDVKRNPFILLNKKGGNAIFKSKKDANFYYNSLIQHGFKPEIIQGGIADEEVPVAMQTLAEKDRYQGADCYTVVIPHHQLEQWVALALAQYHPYNIEAGVREWYASRKLDRPTLLGQEVRQNFSKSLTGLPVYTADSARVSFSASQDLVRLTAAAQDTQAHHTKKPHHIVILLDDSGSMGNGPGSKMNAANEALSTFIVKMAKQDKETGSKTLISIQPFNETTLAHRVPVSEMVETVKQELKAKAKYITTQATGGTPLHESLACSASLVRSRVEDTLISKDELDRTTIALLTDGEANGTAQEALTAMQQSEYKGSLFLQSLDVGVTSETFISYGVKGFKCQQLPVVFPISIGADSDATFMNNLADTFKVPGAFVPTDANMKTKINEALNLLTQMRGRVGQVFIGISFESNGKIETVGFEEQNIFFGRTRDVFLPIPKDAKNLQIFTIVDGNVQQQTASQLANTSNDAKIINALITTYAKQQLMELKLHYAKEANRIKLDLASTMYKPRDANAPINDGARFSAVVDVKPLPVEERPLVLSNAKKVIPKLLESLDKAKAAMESSDLKVVMKTYEDAKKIGDEIFKLASSICQRLQQISPSEQISAMPLIDYMMESMKSLDNTMDEIVARYNKVASQVQKEELKKLKAETIEKATQLMSICKDSTLLQDINLFHTHIAKATVGQLNIDQITPGRQDIANYTQVRFGAQAPARPVIVQGSPEVDEILNLIAASKYNEVMQKLTANPNLINEKSSDKHQSTPLISAIVLLGVNSNSTLSTLISKMLTLKGVDLTQTDATGNTALHRAAWYGQTELAKDMLIYAKKTKQTHVLKSIRNKTMVGATCGETILDNIRNGANTKLSPQNKIDLQKLMGVEKDFASPEEVASEFKANPACLNTHESQDWNTPLMVLLRALRDAPTLKDKKMIREIAYHALDKGWLAIDFTEANFNGDTLLHSAIWYGEYDLAIQILDFAKAKSPEHLAAVVAARNTQGQKTITGGKTISGGGETPHMNLAARGSEAFKAFKKQYCAIIPIINTYLVRAPDLYTQGATFDGLLKKIVSRLKVESKTSEHKDELEIEIAAVEEVLWAFKQLKSWQSLSEELKGSLTDKQRVELNGLLQVYGKEIEGYSAMNFMQSSPLLQLERLISACNNDQFSSSPAARLIKKLLLGLKNGNSSLREVDQMLKTVQEHLTHMPKLPVGMMLDPHQVINQKVTGLYNDVTKFLTTYQALLKGETATLNNLISSVCSFEIPIPERKDEPEDNDTAAFVF